MLHLSTSQWLHLEVTKRQTVTTSRGKSGGNKGSTRMHGNGRKNKEKKRKQAREKERKRRNYSEKTNVSRVLPLPPPL